MSVFTRETWLELLQGHSDYPHDAAPALSTGAGSSATDGATKPGAYGADAPRATSAPAEAADEKALVRIPHTWTPGRAHTRTRMRANAHARTHARTDARTDARTETHTQVRMLNMTDADWEVKTHP